MVPTKGAGGFDKGEPLQNLYVLDSHWHIVFIRCVHPATNINILNGTNGRAVIDGHIQPKIHLHVEAFSGKSEVYVELGTDMYTTIDIDARSTFTSEPSVIVPVLEPPKARSVDEVTRGWVGVKGGILISSASKGAFWGSSETKQGQLLKQEWNISKVRSFL